PGRAEDARRHARRGVRRRRRRAARAALRRRGGGTGDGGRETGRVRREGQREREGVSVSATATDKSDPKQPLRLELAEKAHRPLGEIQADIARVRVEWDRLEPVCRDQYLARQQALNVRAEARRMHQANPMTSLAAFNEAMFPVPAE